PPAAEPDPLPPGRMSDSSVSKFSSSWCIGVGDHGSVFTALTSASADSLPMRRDHPNLAANSFSAGAFRASFLRRVSLLRMSVTSVSANPFQTEGRVLYFHGSNQTVVHPCCARIARSIADVLS